MQQSCNWGLGEGRRLQVLRMCREGDAKRAIRAETARNGLSEFKEVGGLERCTPLVSVWGEAPEKFEAFGYPGNFWVSYRGSQGSWKDYNVIIAANCFLS